MSDGSALERFRASMTIDHEKWHDGVGYDLTALAAATPAERTAIEALLLTRGVADWRDVEALAALATPGATAALRAAARDGPTEVRTAVARHAPSVIGEDDRTAVLVHALVHAELYGGLGAALDEVERFHPPPVVDALFRGLTARDGETAVLFAAMLMFVHGKADSAFDWDQRPYFLRFHTEDRHERAAMVADLCRRLEVPAERWLTPPPAS